MPGLYPDDPETPRILETKHPNKKSHYYIGNSYMCEVLTSIFPSVSFSNSKDMVDLRK